MVLSIIIPTRNRSKRIGALVDSFAHQEPVPFEWEVVVIDNGSRDRTEEEVRKRIDILNMRLRYFFEPQVGLHFARHRGAKEAYGEILAYLDDDMILDRRWIHGINLLLEDKADAVVGPVLPKWEVKPPRWVKTLWKRSKYGSACVYFGLLDLGRTAKPVKPNYIFGGNCFIGKETLLVLGGFHPDGMPQELIRYRGDGETGLMNKFKEKGFRSYYDPQALAYHVIGGERLTIEFVCQRAYNQGISDSFSSIRMGRQFDRPLQSPPRVEDRKEKSETPFSVRVKRAIRERIQEIYKALRREPFEEIKAKIREAYQSGWDFHQSEVKKDQALLDYVLKTNYLGREDLGI